MFRKRVVFIQTVIFSAGVCFSALQAGPIRLDGGLYSETFDAIGGGLPDGVSVHTGVTVSANGALSDFVPDLKSWGDSSGAFKNLASTNGLADGSSPIAQSNSSGRAIGVRTTGAFGDPGAAVVVSMADTLGYSNIIFSVTLLMLSVQTRSQVWTIDYRVGESGAFTVLGSWTDSGAWGGETLSFALGAAADDQSEPLYIRVAALSGSTGSGSRDTIALDGFVLAGTPVTVADPKDEPTGHATGLAALTTTHRTIALAWIDAAAGGAPDGYLVRGSRVGFEAIAVPVDGGNVANRTDWADGTYANKIAQGVQCLEMRGLMAGQPYYFKLFPYSNANSAIDYKTDGELPLLKVTTAVAPFEDVEDVSQLSYTTNTIHLKSGAWLFENAMIGMTADDKRQDQKSARIQGAGALTMEFDVTDTETFALDHACYGADTGGRFVVEISVDGGGIWTQTGPETACGAAFAPAVFAVHRRRVRLRIRKTAAESGTARINIDNMRLTPFENEPSVFRFR